MRVFVYYIYNVLNKAFDDKNFNKSLNWGDPEKMEASKASVDIFAGNASDLITDLSDIQPLDLILFKSNDGIYIHMTMIIDDHGLKITQSALTTCPNGVRIDDFSIVDGKPVVNYDTIWGKSF